MTINSRFFNRSELIGFVVLAVVLFVILPLSLDVFRLNLVAKYLTYAFVALGLVMCWGYGGILSLGQGVFFGLGGYCMAMFLKLEASSVANTKIQSTPGIPDFMDWNQITSLPLFWQPFHSLTFTIARHHSGARPVCADHRRGDVQAPRRRHLLRHHHPGGRRDPDHPDRRPAGLYRRHQRHDRSADAEGLGHPARPRQDRPVLRRGGAAVRLHLHRAVHPADQARPHPGGDARAGRPRPLLRLQRRQLQDLRLLRRPRSSPRSAAPCSRCRSGSCRRPSSASCRRSRW